MNIKKSLASALKKSSETFISKNTASLGFSGVEDMPKVLKKTR